MLTDAVVEMGGGKATAGTRIKLRIVAQTKDRSLSGLVHADVWGQWTAPRRGASRVRDPEQSKEKALQH